ncbi:hypothetical protein [Leeuwenhoekiella marinoflava]|uniref:Uncharacterized protein n=2 Tax=Leeuwenhoekiella marinoflava TaxID=988 RepID=A0A4Q0PN01_9FLAO|nr:hypothetical protein [Leeuwenhoekiella marinoflava]RXG31791.1 hypothetical protein DSL99_1615 [Leeuwenhoekiella marinoflava]SHF05029.1 hypothetical protein SAMN02745246_01567 [Leeuwenhoekiella marinoflava DSM 3653]
MKTIFKLENATVNEIIYKQMEILLKLQDETDYMLKAYEKYSSKPKKQQLVKLNIPEGLAIDLIYGALILFEKETFIDVSMLEFLEKTFDTFSSKIHNTDEPKQVIDNMYESVFQSLPDLKENKPHYLNQFYEACAYLHKLSDITYVMTGDFNFNIPYDLLIMLSDIEASTKLMNHLSTPKAYNTEFDNTFYKWTEILEEETKGEVIQKRFKEMLNTHVDKLTPTAVCKA